MIHGTQKRHFGKGHVVIDSFVAHIPSSEKFDGGNMAQNLYYIKQYLIFIVIFRKFFEVIFRNYSIEKLGTVAASKIACGGYRYR
jgi:hypothetical protein